ncbi:S49 family peptidase [Leeia sp. TBRC 13508]|uniref:S49 family peptidase n=1 Tax=Leeia speluncae TaxID=2884804 RepID=A0ABS8D1N2_9NEIS|nr:S49 family peptidase [Leeia speluncae]MCB6182114.1 S49 family peptidase [Leeia speluncae]
MSDSSNQTPNTEPNWERKVLEGLVKDVLKEQRVKRRWGIFFKLVWLGIIGLSILLMIGLFSANEAPETTRPHTALIRLDGVIAANEEANAEAIIKSLQKAFAAPNTKGVILKINSPGGSPVQAGMIHDEILRLRKLNPSIPLYAVVEDMCASGGYYVAVAADKIYVDKASLVGSIGVLMDGFGFTGTMEKLGVERRLITAGENKGFMDPFSPLNDAQQGYAKQMLAQIHQQFIDVVKEGRGNRLKEDPLLFSGLVWNGAKSIEMGLADELGSVGSVSRNVLKAEFIVDYSPRDSFAARLAKQAGVRFGQGVGSLATQQTLQ